MAVGSKLNDVITEKAVNMFILYIFRADRAKEGNRSSYREALS